MATWKKLIVSGSNISQLNNDSGYLTSVTAQPAFVSASAGGTALIANNSLGNLIFSTGSSSTGVVISGSASNDTITFTLTSIPNTALANDGITIAGADTSLGGTITAAAIGNAGGFLSSSAQIASNISGSITATSASIAEDIAAFPSAATISGSLSADGIAGLAAGIVSASAFSSPSQGTVRATINGTVTNVDTGLQTGDSPTFTDLTLTGDLTVQGDQTILNTTNLAVEDKFILINSGSGTATDESGIIFGGANGAKNAGAALIWNGDYNGNDGRLAVANALNATASSATVSYYVGGVFDGTVNDAATAQADHRGNIRVDGSDDIFIYV
jgi:hypothetical protein|tara:strand:- start:2367 stop:3356 length:990 start_codon:yes stop_codon:yes gene_type:complete